MGTLGAIIGTIIFGAVIGMLARLALPGKQQISALLTVALGVAGWLMYSMPTCSSWASRWACLSERVKA